MDLLEALTGSLLWATLFSIALFVGGQHRHELPREEVKAPEAIASGLKLIALFVALQVFLLLGGRSTSPASLSI